MCLATRRLRYCILEKPLGSAVPIILSGAPAAYSASLIPVGIFAILSPQTVVALVVISWLPTSLRPMPGMLMVMVAEKG
jgi:hypothetical protein